MTASLETHIRALEAECLDLRVRVHEAEAAARRDRRRATAAAKTLDAWRREAAAILEALVRQRSVKVELSGGPPAIATMSGATADDRSS
jgi:hypothetical protein